MSNEISEIKKSLDNHILQSTQVAVRTETLIQELTKSHIEQSENVKAVIKSNHSLELKISSLETKALERLDVMSGDIEKNKTSILLLDKRVDVLELVNANKIGQETANEKNEKRGFSVWAAVLTGITTAIALTTLILQFFIQPKG